jgi:gluconolactonase
VIETFDAKIEALVDPGTELELLADGFEFTEGPVWHFGEQQLTFSDIPADTMYRWDEVGGVRVFRKPSNFSNGMTYDLDGALVVCEHRTRRVTRETGGHVEVVVDRFAGKRLNAPNDVIVAHDRSLLFTDPHYGLGEGFGGPADQDQPVRGVYRVAPGRREAELLVDDFEGPNGLALSPDERTLYVDDSEHGHIRTFAVEGDWSLKGGNVLVAFPDEDEGVVDGLKVDSDGNVYCTGPGGVWICSPTGAVLGRIPTPEVAANLAWGDDDAQTLYVTASTGLYRIRCRAAGYAPHRSR